MILKVFILVFLTVNGAVLDTDENTMTDATKRSRIRHHLGGDHKEDDPDIDHDLFLGDELSTEFDRLSPEESQRRLSMIVDRIDSDLNGLVTEEELYRWIAQVQEREVIEDTERQWNERVASGKEKISWPEYRKVSYGFLLDDNDDKSDGMNFTAMINRDRRRFHAADKNSDKKLDKEEFQAFLHPEDALYMKDLVILETMEDMDSNNDNKIDVDEYMKDLWQGNPGEEPDWVKEEREKFYTERDIDKDEVLNFEEIKDWISPEGYDPSRAEANHLIITVDQDMDSMLSKMEIMDRYDIFVGSQATQFGEMLVRHEEF